MRSQPWGALAGLLVGWSPLAAVLSAAAATAIVTVFQTILVIVLPVLSLFGGPGAPSGQLNPLVAAALRGALSGAGQLLRGQVAVHILGLLIAGAITAAVLTALSVAWEPWYLRLRGFRRPSRRETTFLAPLIANVVNAMERDGAHVGRLPGVLIWDNPQPGAWAFSRNIVLSSGLGLHSDNRQADDEELQAVIAHELHHWRMGDNVGTSFATACAWPAIFPLAVALWLNSARVPVIGGISWFFVWPDWLLLKFVFAPALAIEQREHEYEADEAAARLGFGYGMRSALSRLQPFEPARNRWESVVYATHPPNELRLERLETLADTSS